MIIQNKYTYRPGDLKKLSYNFSLSVLEFAKTLPSDKVLLPILDQLIKSSTSIGANIIEANYSSSQKEAKNFFEIAMKSSQKSEYWLSLIKDSYDKDSDHLILKVQNVRGMLDMILNSIDSERSLYD